MLALLLNLSCVDPKPQAQDDSGCASSTWPIDQDGDGFAGTETVQACSAPDNAAAATGDCDDSDPAVHPDAAENCNGHDDDCDGLTDPDLPTWYTDADGDGYGDAFLPVQACDAPEGTVADATDCDDSRDDTWPGAVEVWYDGIDQDCAGGDDYDADLDSAQAESWGGQDCNDQDPLIGPHAEEICHNGVDEDCDGGDSTTCALRSYGRMSDADVRLEASHDGELLGMALRMVGDLNGDGVPLLAISATDTDGEAGQARVSLLKSGDGRLVEVGSVGLSVEGWKDWSFGYRVHEPSDADENGDPDLWVFAGQAVSTAWGGPGTTFIYLDPVEGDLDATAADILVVGPEEDYSWGGFSVAALDGWADDTRRWAFSSPGWTPTDPFWQGGQVDIVELEGPETELDASTDELICNIEECALGQGLLAVDVNGDGIDDLLASMVRTRSDVYAPSMLATYLGPINGTVDATDYDGGLLSEETGATFSDRIGQTLEDLGDIDGDGVHDLWIAAYLTGATGPTSAHIGAAYRYGADTLATLTTTGADADFTARAGSYDGGLGFSLSHGDVDGDGRVDLLAGAPEYETTEGALGLVAMWSGPEGGTLTVDDADVVWEAETDHGKLGWAIAADDDLNLDGCDDVVMSEPCWPGKESCRGLVALFYGACE